MPLWFWVLLILHRTKANDHDHLLVDDDKLLKDEDHRDTFVEDVLSVMSKKAQYAISENRADDPHKPSHCNGVCLYEETNDEYGVHVWDNTTVGFRRHIICQYALFYENAYAYRDCLLDNDGQGVWSLEANYTECLKIPLVMLDEDWAQARTVYSFRNWVIGGFEMALVVLQSQLFVAVTPHANETIFVYKIAFYVINDYDQLYRNIPFEKLVDFLGYLLHNDFVPAIRKQPQLVFYVNRIFNKLPQITMKYGPANTWMGSPTGSLTYGSGTIGNTSQIIHIGIDFTISVLPCIECSYQYMALILDSDVIVEVEKIFSTIPELLSFLQTTGEGMATLYKQMYYVTAHDFQGNMSESHPQVLTSFPDSKLDYPTCAWNIAESEFFDLSIWQSLPPGVVIPCETTENDYNKATCQCNGTGYFGILHDKKVFIDEATLQTEQPPGQYLILEYSYKYELWILGVILQSISFFCLLAIVGTFIFVRRLHVGRNTVLLLNLCASLIGLEVVLFAAEVTTSSRVGCMVSNILRYYFIMVSLFWNGTEAHSLRVKVFDQGKTRFTVKAAVLSWGLPILAIGAVLTVDFEAFDGMYIDCTFRCIMRERIIFYAYLLPIGVIMLHNFAVFGFVMRILCLPRELTNSEDGKPILTCRHVAGGVALLALLGFPWVFSAFVALDVTKANQHLKRTEAVYQVVFLLGINLQGIFIFVFHCLCNPDIRGQIKQLLSIRSSNKSPTPQSTSSYTTSLAHM